MYRAFVLVGQAYEYFELGCVGFNDFEDVGVV